LTREKYNQCIHTNGESCSLNQRVLGLEKNCWQCRKVWIGYRRPWCRVVRLWKPKKYKPHNYVTIDLNL